MWPLLRAARICESIAVPLRIDPPLHRRRCEFFIENRAFTNAMARRLLGFAPSLSLEEGLRETAQWYFDQGYMVRR